MAENIWPLYRSKAMLDACRLYNLATGGMPYTLQGASFLDWRGFVLGSLGKYRVAEANCLRGLTVKRGLLPEHHPDIASSLNSIGYVLHAQSRLDEALVHFKQALAIRRQALPEHHPHIANSLNSIGIVLQEQNRLDEALVHHKQALSIFEQALGANHPHTITVRNNYRALRKKMGQPQVLSSYKNS